MEDPCDKTTNAADLVPGDVDFHLLHGRDLDRSVFHFRLRCHTKNAKKRIGLLKHMDVS